MHESRVEAGDRAGPRHGQLSQLSVLFADLSGSTRLGAQLDVERYAELLCRWRQLAREQVRAHGGQVVRLQGDGLLAIFGHPEPRTDDGLRAAKAALALHEALRSLEVPGLDEPLSLHSGLHSGPVLLRDGDLELGRFELVGDVPNVAARLCELAPAGQSLASEAALGDEGLDRFRTGLRRLLQIRGHEQPLAAFELQGLAG
ncbi:adenylate/guanylate cyclase domain-containing protein [Pelomonas sp. SE-A7]|uniref:adenylate/guanylate cyclase domain-containing protein n=1 Tax=Pelomonas sp. SE-A7 TaxID=3054953 RepID=UPI00259D083E|nr:adenylate/guanylate cyclase domain-containing protein [Pelomonas sp. SE-A7]MDM4766257.1 adenylate/guanylate cyclase domain-containing protein [Pelomonas sp. SE-A7]